MIKKITFVCLLLLATTTTLHAQANWAINHVTEQQYNQEIREKLALDYSMPDFTTHKLDSEVIGSRLSSMLHGLLDNYQHTDYLSYLSQVQCNQIEGLDYCTIEAIKLKEVTKSDNKITVHFNTTLAHNPRGIKKSDLLISFVDGVSTNKIINALFTNICNYMK